jgi:exodeoxyribonuclease VII small subunit
VTQQTQFNFEEAMQRLEEIVEAFDSGQMTLRQMEASFIEGMNLIKQCSACLDGVELRVKELSGAEEETQPEDEDLPV